MMNNEEKTTGERLGYAAPQLKRWGDISDMTQLGNSGGPGDIGYNKPGKQVGSENGSVFPGGHTYD
ncbi:hypothetical protein [Franzmannia qiaohouensis]|uniref:Uncharacterized protein n=1 Tax=Franzmannia qiaohouensis TaxID=1329370 RepID=A0ABU1HJ89_9GAMM|nr:hypothetical protein [Halomonas qiaohouensis]MDR5906874.1 hypothetical protein [Halomonas qiaohouensis]